MSIRDVWSFARAAGVYGVDPRQSGAEFDRWLTEHDAEARTAQITIHEVEIAPSEVARQVAWQVRKESDSHSLAHWLPLVVLSCSAVLQVISLVALLMRTA